MATRRPPASRVRPHRFVVDEHEPRDYRNRAVCRLCRLLGEPGDSRHPLNPPAPPAPRRWTPALVEAAREREAALLGERDTDQ